jgi:hypothetical protein
MLFLYTLSDPDGGLVVIHRTPYRMPNKERQLVIKYHRTYTYTFYVSVKHILRYTYYQKKKDPCKHFGSINIFSAETEWLAYGMLHDPFGPTDENLYF